MMTGDGRAHSGRYRVDYDDRRPQTSATTLIVPDLLGLRVNEQPDAVALVVDRVGSMTYRTWEQRSNAVARGLVSRGVEVGDRVVLVFGNDHWLDYAVSYIGVQKAGAAAVPLGSRFSDHEVAQVVAHCQAVLTVGPDAAGSATTQQLERSASTEPFHAAPHPSDLAEILYTSGTTGLPKGVACSHESVLFHDAPPEPQDQSPERASFVHAFPIGTNAGQEVLRLPLRRGDRISVALPVFDPERFCALVAERRVRRLQLVPAMAQLLVTSGAPARHDVSSVERVTLSSAPLPPTLLTAVAQAFPNATLWNTYALTEAGTARTLLVDATAHHGSVGLPVGGTELRIVDDSTLDVGPGDTGEILIRRPGAPSRCYFRDPEATAATFSSGGWVHTGDLGYLDAEGYLYLVDRKKDLVIVGGLNVSSVEVENVLHEHPAVFDAAVFGIPHPVLGQDVAAAVVIRAPVGSADLQAFVRARLGEHKVPHHFEFVDELPRNASGKVRKLELRDRFAGNTPAVYVAPSTPVEAAIVAIWADVLGRPRIGVDDDFFDLAGHSLAAAQIVARIQTALQVSVPLTSFFESPTPAGLAMAIQNARHSDADQTSAGARDRRP